MSSVALQSEDHRRLLDIVDRLRSRGISKYVDLPEIVVCGDQSAGKSSVLEAISGMSFPTKDNLCTRFATELVLRREASTSVKVSIIPGPDRSETEIEQLSDIHFDLDSADLDVGSIVERAKQAMGLSENRTFSADTLRVELCGMSQPHLTMVDLPGLFRAGNRDQAVEDAAIVKHMVTSYMKRPRSIILAVVSAKSDFALQEVTELARELDPKGMRTLGLITKPDTLDAGSDSETAYVKLAQNEDVSFGLGWHVLKNRSYETRNASSSERDEEERIFFATGVWAAMDPSCVGMDSLKERLSNVLKEQILHQLPSLLHDVEVGIGESRTKMVRLGNSRVTFADQRQYLLQVAQEFSALIKSAVDGVYINSFFGSAKTNEGYRRRLRAVVQSLLGDFEEITRLEGEARVVIDDLRKSKDLGPRKILRTDLVVEVKQIMRRSRGCELPGTFNPLVVGELFTEQCEPWKNLATRAKDQIVEATHNTVAAAINNITVLETTNGILQIIHRGLDKMKTDLERKTTELLEPYFTTHPITYNHYLTDTVQKAQSARRRRNFGQTLKELFGVDHLDNERYQVQPAHLLNLLDQRIEADMESYASNSAIDYMQAYYKVALKRFVDDFSVLAVEQCLVGRLPSLFTPEMVQKLSEEDVSGLASETEHTTAQRSQCLEKLAVLEEGLRDLKSLDKHRLILQDSDIERETNFGQPLLQRHRSITGLADGGSDVVNGEDTNMASAPGSPPLAEVIVDPPEDVWPPTPSKKKKKAGHSTLGF